MELEYTPQSPKKIEAPAPQFVLVNDVTGKPPLKRGPQILRAYSQDKNGKQVVIQFKVPYPPKSNCKKCLGRGYLGVIVREDARDIVICKKCFPMM